MNWSKGTSQFPLSMVLHAFQSVYNLQIISKKSGFKRIYANQSLRNQEPIIWAKGFPWKQDLFVDQLIRALEP